MKKISILISSLLLAITLLTSCATKDISIPKLQMPQPGSEGCEALSFSTDFKLDIQPKELPVYMMTIANQKTQMDEILSVPGLDYGEITPLKEGNGPYQMYKAGDGTLMLDKELGFWVYSTPIGSEPVEDLPSDEEALKIADDAVKNSKLFDGDLGLGIVTYVTTGNGDIVNSDAIVQKNIVYYPKVNGIDVHGIFRIIVGIGEKGEIVSFSKQVHNFTEAAKVQLKDINSIVTSVKNGDYVASTSSPVASAEIISCRLAYYSDAAVLDGNLFIHPVYILSAVGENTDGVLEEFDVYVDAAQ